MAMIIVQVSRTPSLKKEYQETSRSRAFKSHQWILERGEQLSSFSSSVRPLSLA